MRRAIASLLVLAALGGRAWAQSCSPWNAQGHTIWDCGKLEGTAWLVTAPAWVPLTVVYMVLGGELPAQRAQREEQQRQQAAAINKAWDAMTPERRQEVIQLLQLQQQQRALAQQQQQHNTEMLLEWQRNVNQMYQSPPPPAASPSTHTVCRQDPFALTPTVRCDSQ